MAQEIPQNILYLELKNPNTIAEVQQALKDFFPEVASNTYRSDADTRKKLHYVSILAKDLGTVYHLGTGSMTEVKTPRTIAGLLDWYYKLTGKTTIGLMDQFQFNVAQIYVIENGDAF